MVNHIRDQRIDKVVRQSEGYYMYLHNGARILFIKYGNQFQAIPSKKAGKMNVIPNAVNLIDAMRKYAEKYGLKNKNRIVSDKFSLKQFKDIKSKEKKIKQYQFNMDLKVKEKINTDKLGYNIKDRNKYALFEDEKSKLKKKNK